MGHGWDVVRLLRGLLVSAMLLALLANPVTAAFPDVDRIRDVTCNPKKGLCAGDGSASLRATWVSARKVKVRITLIDPVADSQWPWVRYRLISAKGKVLVTGYASHTYVPGTTAIKRTVTATHRTRVRIDRMRVVGDHAGCASIPSQQVWCSATWTLRPGGR